MAKGSKSSGKGEPKIPIKEEAFIASGKEETVVSGNGRGGVDFFYVLAGGGALLSVILIIFIVLRYILHVV